MSILPSLRDVYSDSVKCTFITWPGGAPLFVLPFDAVDDDDDDECVTRRPPFLLLVISVD